jgi:hypothetical protein
MTRNAAKPQGSQRQSFVLCAQEESDLKVIACKQLALERGNKKKIQRRRGKGKNAEN